MALPSSFDPITGTIGRVGNTVRNIAPTPISRTTSSYTSSSSRSGGGFRAFWNRLNYGVSSIGEWLQDTGAGIIALIIAGIPAITGIISLIVWVFKTFSGEGFIWGCLSVFGALIAIGIGYYAIMLLYGIAYFVLYLVGFVFYNAYTLLAAIALLLVLNVPRIIDFRSKAAPSQETEVTAPSYTVYSNTARVLNVRKAPSTGSEVIGTLQRGESVKVRSISGGFAEIEWNGSVAYVSSEYLTR